MAVQKNASLTNKPASEGSGLFGFFKGLKAEFKKITWPCKPDVKKATITVVTFCLIYVVLVGLLDGMFSEIVKIVFK